MNQLNSDIDNFKATDKQDVKKMNWFKNFMKRGIAWALVGILIPNIGSISHILSEKIYTLPTEIADISTLHISRIDVIFGTFLEFIKFIFISPYSFFIIVAKFTPSFLRPVFSKLLYFRLNLEPWLFHITFCVLFGIFIFLVRRLKIYSIIILGLILLPFVIEGTQYARTKYFYISAYDLKNQGIIVKEINNVGLAKPKIRISSNSNDASYNYEIKYYFETNSEKEVNFPDNTSDNISVQILKLNDIDQLLKNEAQIIKQRVFDNSGYFNIGTAYQPGQISNQGVYIGSGKPINFYLWRNLSDNNNFLIKISRIAWPNPNVIDQGIFDTVIKEYINIYPSAITSFNKEATGVTEEACNVYQNQKEKCLLGVAQYIKNPSACDSINSKNQKEDCLFWAVGDNIDEDIAACDKISGSGTGETSGVSKNDCITNAAARTKNIAYCERANFSDEIGRYICFDTIATLTDNPDICEKINPSAYGYSDEAYRKETGELPKSAQPLRAGCYRDIYRGIFSDDPKYKGDKNVCYNLTDINQINFCLSGGSR